MDAQVKKSLELLEKFFSDNSLEFIEKYASKFESPDTNSPTWDKYIERFNDFDYNEIFSIEAAAQPIQP